MQSATEQNKEKKKRLILLNSRIKIKTVIQYVKVLWHSNIKPTLDGSTSTLVKL